MLQTALTVPNLFTFTKWSKKKCGTFLYQPYIYTVKPVLNGISRDQNVFPLKPGFRLIKLHYI